MVTSILMLMSHLRFVFFNPVQDYLIDWLVSSQIPPNKMNLGIPFYGVSLNLSDPSQTDLGSPILGDGVGGPLLGDTGSLAYYEVSLSVVPCVLLKG